MTPAELRDWLGTDNSKSVGDTRGDGESTGHQSGRHFIAIKGKKKADLTDDNWAHMARVIGCIKRRGAQGGPQNDKERSDRRFSLMNRGHDPLT